MQRRQAEARVELVEQRRPPGDGPLDLLERPGWYLDGREHRRQIERRGAWVARACSSSARRRRAFGVGTRASVGVARPAGMGFSDS